MPECKTDKDHCDILPVAGEAWNVCLPFGGRIWSDSNGIHAAGGLPPPDGVYGKVVIADGCIVGVEPADVPLYTGSPCAPAPNGCGGTTSVLGDGFTPGGTVITCEIEAGAGVSVSGSGTEADPYVISADTGVYIRSDNSAIALTGAGTRNNPFTLAHKTGVATTVNGLTFDAFGHLSSVSTDETAGSKGIKGIVPGFGISANTDNVSGIATVGLQSQVESVPGDYQLGGFNAVINQAGQVSSITQQIMHEDAPVKAVCGTTDLVFNQYGSITSAIDTMDLGAAYLAAWSAGTAVRTAQFTMRCNSALAGVCLAENKVFTGVQFLIDGQVCDRIDNLFWGSGIYIVGTHTLEVVGGTGAMAVLLHAITLMENT